MKLIRLATDNDGVFQSSFQNDMIISPKSQMALLNLTFKSEYDVLNVNSSNSKVTVKTDSTVATSEGTLDLNEAIYTEADYNSFLRDLEFTMNAAIADDDQINCMSSQWNIRDYEGRKRLEYRYAPFFNPLNMKVGGTGSELSLMSFNPNRITLTYPLPNKNHTIFRKIDGIPNPNTEDTSDNLLSSAKLCSGNGIMLARSFLNLTNGNASIYDNGFGIGLSRKNLAATQSAGTVIAYDDRNYEVRVNRPTENWYYTNKDDNIVEIDSGIIPQNLGGTGGPLENRDTAFFKRFGGTLEVGVLQEIGGVGVKQVFFTVELGDEEPDLYPYIFINGAAGFQHIDLFNYSIDPWVNQSFSENATNDIANGWSVTGLNSDQASFNAYSNGLDEAIVAPGVLFSSTGGYLNLPEGGNWIQSGTGTTENYDEINVDGSIAQYRRTQVGAPGLDQWWEANGQTAWKVYNNKPLIGGVNTPDFTATIDLATGIITIGTTTFTPAVVPTLTGQVPLFPLPNPTNWEDNLVCELTLHKDIWKFLGFTAFGGDNYLQSDIPIGLSAQRAEQKCWSWRLAENQFRIQQSDNFIVTSESVALDSHDASRVHYVDQPVGTYNNPASDKMGRRKNILITIPVNNNTSGLVEYEASTPIFIDINNATELNLKNLNFRILNKDFKPIQQSSETAIMTVLIKKGSEEL